MRTLLLGVTALALACFSAGTALAVGDDGLAIDPPGSGIPDSPLPADGSLTTIFAQNNGFNGNSFDITANVALTVVGWDLNLDAGTWNVEIYTRDGTANGFEQTGPWTLLGTEVVVGAGPDLPSACTIGGLELAAGQLVGVIARVQERTAFNYTNGGPNVYSNADMSCTTYAGISGPEWPPASVFAGRIWNGTIYYDYMATPVEAETWGAIKSLF